MTSVYAVPGAFRNDRRVTAPDQEPSAETEQHATWTELFFDLVVVAGVGQLAHVLVDDSSPAGIAVYAAMYFAFWTAWTGFTVYGDARGERTRLPVMLIGMLGMAVLAVSVPHVHEGHVEVFVIGYVVLRWLSGHVWQRAVVMDWPLARMGLGTLLWIISLWVAAPARYWLWAAGIAIDFFGLLTVSGQRTLQRFTERIAQLTTRRGVPADRIPPIEAVYSRTEHLAERLGLFVIIVLGEGVIQIVSAASHATWDVATTVSAAGAFAVLVAVWAVCLLRGFAGVPQLIAERLPMRQVMFLHALTTVVIAALAASLGAAVEHAVEGPMPASWRWLMCGTVLAFVVLCAIGRVFDERVRVVRLLAWVGPGVAVPVAIGLFGGLVGTGWTLWAVAATVALQAALTANRAPRSRAARAAQL